MNRKYFQLFLMLVIIKFTQTMDLSDIVFTDKNSYLSRLPFDTRTELTKHVCQNSDLIPSLIRHSIKNVPYDVRPASPRMRASAGKKNDQPWSFNEKLRILIIREADTKPYVMLWENQNKPLSVEFNNNKKIALIQHGDGSIIYNCPFNKIIYNTKCYAHLSPDGTKIVERCTPKEIRLIDLTSHATLVNQLYDQKKPMSFSAPRFTTDDQIVATCQQHSEEWNKFGFNNFTIYRTIGWDISGINAYEEKLRRLPDNLIFELSLLYSMIKKTPSSISDERIENVVHSIENNGIRTTITAAFKSIKQTAIAEQ